MNKRAWAFLTVILFLSAATVALASQEAQDSLPPCDTRTREACDDAQDSDHPAIERLHRELARRHAEMARRFAYEHHELAGRLARDAQARATLLNHELAARARELRLRGRELAARLRAEQDWSPLVVYGDEGDGWLGITMAEVTAERAKELKLPAERGVLVSGIEEDSPAAKAGLKANDVITEFNGQRVEGIAQFRRLVRETPPGRAVQLTVWRDGRSQTLSATLESPRRRVEGRVRVYTPREFAFNWPEAFSYSWSSPTPTIGIVGEDLSGQLGEYFSVPGGEGILVREVRPGTPAAKAGMKSGDVITKVNNERVRTLSDLREKLRDKREQKTINLTVLRRGTETSLNVELEQPRPAERRPGRRTIV